MSFHIYRRHRVCLVDHVDLICSLYSWWEGFGSSSLAALPPEFQLWFYFHLCMWEKEMATHSGTLAWKIPWIEKPGADYSPWGHIELDMTEGLHFHSMWVVHWGLCLRLPWRTWVCPSEGQVWRWCSCLAHRGPGSSRYSGELSTRAAGLQCS